MTAQVGTKWKLKKLCPSTCFFIVIDRVSGKEYQYQVPNMETVELAGDCVYVYTKANKVLQIDLLTTNRKFVEKKPLNPAGENTEVKASLSLVKVS